MKDRIDYAEFVDICNNRKIELTEAEKEKIVESRKIFEAIIKSNPKTAYYGINTGVGALLGKRIPKNKLREFQENLVCSHACGVGEPLEKDLTRGIMLHMILNLKKGCSAIRLETLEFLVEMFNGGIIPAVPCKGSLGASGDLIPQAHVALAMIGKDSEQILHSYGLTPIKLEMGEAIALLNGTSFMTSILAFLVFQSDILIETADRAASLTIDVLGCNPKSFEDEIQRLRPHLGQIVTAYKLGNILKKRNLKIPSSVQDAYSLRCIPQVHGAFRETLFRARDVIDIEINSFCGNPVLITGQKEPILMQGSGNFHGQILAQTADSLSIALAALGNISERRIERPLNHKFSGLTPFLARKDGLNTGLMIAQYAAASLVSENKTLAHPASVDSIPVSGGQEDFVSMGAWAVRKAWEILKNTEYVIAIEVLCGCRARNLIRDTVLSEDIEIIRNIIHQGKFPEGDSYFEKNY